MAWRKPKRSNPNGECVEVNDETGIEVRDSKNADGAILALSPAAWKAFTDEVKTR
jgi:hypothetical protein